MVKTLSSIPQTDPTGTIFDDDVFAATCRKLGGKSKAGIAQDLTPLIVPPAEILALYNTDLEDLVESVNCGWDNSVPFTRTRPQPDNAVGFRQAAFAKDQLSKLSPFIGNFIAKDESFFMGTYTMFFPFLTCEVCGDTGIEVADRQNAHSMTIAVRVIVELFRLIKREDEVDRQILAFSVSHSESDVRIYGHYPKISAGGTEYYRHKIHQFAIDVYGGKDRWTANRFTKNIYHAWAPEHLGRICSAVDQLPPPQSGSSLKPGSSRTAEGCRAPQSHVQSTHLLARKGSWEEPDVPRPRKRKRGAYK